VAEPVSHPLFVILYGHLNNTTINNNRFCHYDMMYTYSTLWQFAELVSDISQGSAVLQIFFSI